MMVLLAWLVWLFYFNASWSFINTRVYFYELAHCPQFKNLAQKNLTHPHPLIGTAVSNMWKVGSDGDDGREVNGADVLPLLGGSLEGCRDAFVMWALPAFQSAWAFDIACVIHLIVSVERALRSQKFILDSFAKSILFFLGIFWFAVFVFSVLSGGSMGMTEVILFHLVAFIVLAGSVVGTTLGFNELLTALRLTPLGSLVGKILGSDWVRAMLVYGIVPLLPLYLVLSVPKQALRKCFPVLLSAARREAGNATTESTHVGGMSDDANGMITPEARAVLRILREWSWSSVLTKVFWTSVIFFTLFVGGTQVVVVMLSYLNDTLRGVPMVAATGIYFAAGWCMFLAPPIPGVPIYIAGGVIITANARHTIGFWPAVLYSVAVIYLLKLTANTSQQVIIGKWMGSRSTKVRSWCGVNSVELRAIRVILQSRGMSFAKVAVLCGGPDWPVSVLTGILRQSVSSMVWGSLPVIFVVAPNVFAGASLLLANGGGGTWAAAAPVLLIVAMLVQGVFFLAAIHYIAKTVVEKRNEIDAVPLDEEVYALDHASYERRKTLALTRSWGRLTVIDRALLVVCSALSIGCTYAFSFFGKSCFEAFDVNDSVAVELHGNVWNLVRPPGWAALIALLTACVLLVVFNLRINNACHVWTRPCSSFQSIFENWGARVVARFFGSDRLLEENKTREN